MPEILTVLIYAVIIFVILFLAWYIPRVVSIKGNASGRGRYIAILEKFPITKDSYIMLVKSFDKLLLVGVTPGGMKVLREVDTADVDLTEEDLNSQNFSTVLGSFEKAFPDGKVKDTIKKIAKNLKGGKKDE